MIAKAQAIAASEGGYFTNQIHNSDIIVGHRTMGRELLEQVGQPIDAFCGVSVGSAGMLMGVAHELRNTYPKTRIVALEPSSTAVISGQEAGSHNVEGIGIGFIPPLLDKQLYDEVRGNRRNRGEKNGPVCLAAEGRVCSPAQPSGLNIAGAIQLAEEIGEGKTVVTVAVDTGLKYLAGDLYQL